MKEIKKKPIGKIVERPTNIITKTAEMVIFLAKMPQISIFKNTTIRGEQNKDHFLPSRVSYKGAGSSKTLI